jgi:anti-anti-sigma regulatory factor
MNPHLPPPLGYVIECNGAWLRAQAVGVAMRLEVTGTVDAANRRTLADHLGRFVKLNAPLIVDVADAHLRDDHVLDVFADFEKLCTGTGVEWALVVDARTRALIQSRGLPLVESTAEAVRHLNAAIRSRQRRSATTITLSPPDDQSAADGIRMRRRQATTRNS